MDGRFARFVVLAALAGAGALSSGCALMTDAGDFTVYEGLCNRCPRDGALRQRPCPVPSDAPDTGATYLYARRRVRLGEPRDWEGAAAASFDVGYDLDCSSRPAGRPVTCRPRLDPPQRPWAALPRGIDNALAQRVMAPLYETAESFGVHMSLDGDDGDTPLVGTLFSISDWNGTPDDPHVVFSMHATPGPSLDNGPPRWDGTDRWDVFDEATAPSYFSIDDVEGYVAGGVLVLDAGARGAVGFRITTEVGSYTVLMRDFAVTGRIRPDALENLVETGVIDYASAIDAVDSAAKSLGGCISGASTFLEGKLPVLLEDAADMPLDPDRDPSALCDGLSFAVAYDAYPVVPGQARAAAPGGVCGQ